MVYGRSPEGMIYGMLSSSHWNRVSLAMDLNDQGPEGLDESVAM